MESYWSFRAVMDDTTEDDLADCARALLDGHRDRWEWRRSGTWIRLTPIGVRIPPQGWKLHIAATSRNAGDVLATVMPILLREQVPFKFAATREQVVLLNTPNTPREAAGKFITIYPVDDTQAVRIAQACDSVTEGFAGPAILSDRPVRPGSVVHYRYGVFHGGRMFDNDGGLSVSSTIQTATQCLMSVVPGSPRQHGRMIRSLPPNQRATVSVPLFSRTSADGFCLMGAMSCTKRSNTRIRVGCTWRRTV